MPTASREIRRDIDRHVHADLQAFLEEWPNTYVKANLRPRMGWIVEIWQGNALVALDWHKRLGIAFLSAVAEAKGTAA